MKAGQLLVCWHPACRQAHAGGGLDGSVRRAAARANMLPFARLLEAQQQCPLCGSTVRADGLQKVVDPLGDCSADRASSGQL